MIRSLITGLTTVFISSCASERIEEPTPTGEQAFSFVVIGDTPYSSEDEEMLTTALPLIKGGDFPFVIHVGDYKGGRAPCSKDHDDRFAALIAALKPTPVFYTPGDNEWTDCDRNIDPKTGRNWSDLVRLDIVRDRFFESPPATPEDLAYERQQVQIENATWRYRGVRFGTIHVVGTANGRDWVTGDPLPAAQTEVEARDKANTEWLKQVVSAAIEEDAVAIVIAMQADPTDVEGDALGVACEGVVDHDAKCDAFAALRVQLKDLAADFKKPVLLIHGDTAPFTLNQEFAGAEAANLWRLNAAGDAGVGVAGDFYGVRDVTLVTIDTSATAPFFARGLVGGKPAKN